MDSDNQNWYQKLAASGWLGTKAQVANQYGDPIWKNSANDPTAQALQNLRQKAAQQPDESSGS